MNIGFIGLGLMGRPMAINIARGGHALHLWARRAASLEPFADLNARVHASPAEVARHADIIVTIVADAPDVEAVALGENGIAAGAKPGLLVVDMSTIAPTAARRIGMKLAQAGIAFLDAPVSGGESGAINATLSIMAGGERAAFEKMAPIFALMGKSIVHVGAAGAGQVAKACNQIVTGMGVAAVAEAFNFARKSGADLARVREALLGGFASSKILENHGQRMIARNFKPGFKAWMHQKDVRIVMEEAHRLGLMLPGAAVTAQLFNAMTGAGLGEEDSVAMLKLLERLSGGEGEGGEFEPARPASSRHPLSRETIVKALYATPSPACGGRLGWGEQRLVERGAQIRPLPSPPPQAGEGVGRRPPQEGDWGEGIHSIGFIGLGVMGRPLALHLIKAGHALSVYARRDEAAQPLIDAGARRLATPADVAAASDVVFTMVTAGADVEQVALGDGGIIHGARPGTVLVDLSTIPPATARRCAARLAERGIAFLDAPVSGGEAGARQATLAIMAGGEAAALARARPLLEKLGKTIVHIGPSGAGQVAKACNQMIMVSCIEALAEAMRLAEKSGVDAEKVRQALAGGSAGSRVLEVFGARMTARDFRAGVEARLHHKDFGILLDEAATLGAPLPIAAQVGQQLNALMAQGWGREDTSILLRVLAVAESGIGM